MTSTAAVRAAGAVRADRAVDTVERREARRAACDRIVASIAVARRRSDGSGGGRKTFSNLAAPIVGISIVISTVVSATALVAR